MCRGLGSQQGQPDCICRSRNHLHPEYSGLLSMGRGGAWNPGLQAQFGTPGRGGIHRPRRIPPPSFSALFTAIIPSELWGDTKVALSSKIPSRSFVLSVPCYPTSMRQECGPSPLPSPCWRPSASSLPHLLGASQNSHSQTPQAPVAPRPSADPTHPLAGAEVLELSEGSWEMAGTCSSWSFFHFPFRLWPGWITGQDGREGLALPLLLKGQGDPVGWVHPWEKLQGHAPCWALPALPFPPSPTPTPSPSRMLCLEMGEGVNQTCIPYRGNLMEAHP